MNKLNLILQCVSYASLVLTGGSAIYNTVQPTPESEVAIVEPQQEDPNEIVTDNDTVTVETKPEDSHHVEKEDTGGSPSPAPQPSENSVDTPAYTPQPSAPVTPTQPTYRFSNIHDFEQAYLYHCPQDVPAGEFHLPLPKYVALGYIGSYTKYTDLNTAAIYAWTLIVGGFGGQSLDVYPRWTNLSSQTLRVEPTTRNVTWVSHISISEETKASLDSLANDLEAAILSLDQQYYAKCGY